MNGVTIVKSSLEAVLQKSEGSTVVKSPDVINVVDNTTSVIKSSTSASITKFEGSIVLKDNGSIVMTNDVVLRVQGAYTFHAPLSASYPDVSIPKATAVVDGYLSAEDWVIFNAKQPAGSYVTEAPNDGTSYVRNSDAWVALPIPYVDAPNDAHYYGRHALAWSDLDSVYLGIGATAADSAKLNGQSASYYQVTLNGTGFVKASGTSISYDNSTYLTSVTAHNLLSSTHGDTTAGSSAIGGTIYADGSTPSKWAQLAGNTTTTKKYLQSVGSGGVATIPSWQQIAYADISGTPSIPTDYWHTLTADTGLTGDKSGSFDLTTTGTGQFGTTYQAVLGGYFDGGNYFGGYFDVGSSGEIAVKGIASLVSGSLAYQNSYGVYGYSDSANPYTYAIYGSGVSFIDALSSGLSVYADYWGSGDYVEFAKNGYAVNATGTSYFSNSTLLAGSDVYLLGTFNGGVYPIGITVGSNANAGLSVIGNGTTNDSRFVDIYSSGGSAIRAGDGTNTVYLADGTNALTVTGIGLFTTTAGVVTLGYGSTGGYMSLFQSSDVGQALNARDYTEVYETLLGSNDGAGNAYALYSHDASNSIYLANGTYVINAIGTCKLGTADDYWETGVYSYSGYDYPLLNPTSTLTGNVGFIQGGLYIAPSAGGNYTTFSLTDGVSTAWELIYDFNNDYGYGAGQLLFYPSVAAGVNFITDVNIAGSLISDYGMAISGSTGEIVFDGDQNLTPAIYVDRRTVSSYVGHSLTIHAGGATAGQTDKAGGTLTLSGGISTGSGGSTIVFQVAVPGGSGTTDRSPTTQMTLASSGALNLSYKTTTVNGVTGTAVWGMPFQGTGYKKFLVYLTNFTSAGTVITFPTAFLKQPYTYGDAAAVATAVTTTTTITLTSVGAVAGFIFVEGY